MIRIVKGTISEIYTTIFSFFGKKVLNIAILEFRSCNITFYRGIHEFLNPSIFEKVTVFEKKILCML